MLTGLHYNLCIAESATNRKATWQSTGSVSYLIWIISTLYSFLGKAVVTVCVFSDVILLQSKQHWEADGANHNNTRSNAETNIILKWNTVLSIATRHYNVILTSKINTAWKCNDASLLHASLSLRLLILWIVKHIMFWVDSHCSFFSIVSDLRASCFCLTLHYPTVVVSCIIKQITCISMRIIIIYSIQSCFMTHSEWPGLW